MRLKNKEIDLVIEDDKILMILIEFLIYELKTVDGMRDSGNFYLRRIYEAQTFSKRNQNILKTLTEHDTQLIKHYNKYVLVTDIIKRFRLLKIRMKIGYSAF